MQHQWDLAFGYVGLPKDYDSGKVYTSAIVDRPLGIGGYFGERGKFIKAGGTVFEAFRKGRAAIGAKDYAVRDAAAATHQGICGKDPCRSHVRLYYQSADASRPGRQIPWPVGRIWFRRGVEVPPGNSKLTEANYQTLMGIMKTDFYALADDASNTKLKQAQSILTAAYGQLQP